MQENTQDKEIEIADTMKSFISQFGEIDIYAKIVLEEFFKEIMHE